MSDYPLIENAADRLRTATGRRMEEITLEEVLAGEVTIGDLRIGADALEEQARCAEEAGRPHLAANLRRASELVSVPEEKILTVYNTLRPGRATREEMLSLADELEAKFSAPLCAALLRDAAG